SIVGSTGVVHVLASHFFVFQAEDGIRDFHVTGVQTCALPIFPFVWVIHKGESGPHWGQSKAATAGAGRPVTGSPERPCGAMDVRSEERRVGKERRSCWSPCDEKIRQEARYTPC